MLKFKKTISIIIISGLLISYASYLTTPPAYALDGGGGYAAAAAGWAHFAKYVLKEFVLDLAARLTARLQLTAGLNGIAQQIIQSGRTGRTPAFIQNWRNFITDSEYRGEDVFRSILANTENCPNIKKDMLNLFGVKGGSPLTQNIRTGNLDPYTVRGKCTLPRGWSIQNYNRDFAGNGGWDALARLADPQNNFYGSTIIAMGELNAQRNLDRTSDLTESMGKGFTGTRKSSRTGNSCDTPPILSGHCESPDGSYVSSITCTSNANCPSFASACVGGGPAPSQARCTFLGNVTTPAEILGTSASEFIDSNLKWLTTSDEISEILGNFINSMVGKLVDYTAKTLVPDKVAEPEKTQYDACVKQCSISSGSAYTTCIDACYKRSGVDLPGSYNSSNFTGSGSTGTCSDGIQNQDETGIDTGGVCGTPSTGTCFDGIQNQNETGVDTGGVCGSSSSGSNVLLSGQFIPSGGKMLSPNGLFELDLQGDGNLVLYDISGGSGIAIWATNTAGVPASLRMEASGNLILYFNGGVVAWQSSTFTPGSVLDLSSGGDLVIYSGIGGTLVKTIFQHP